MKYGVSTRIRCSRSVQGPPFNPNMTKDQYTELENLVSTTLRVIHLTSAIGYPWSDIFRTWLKITRVCTSLSLAWQRLSGRSSSMITFSSRFHSSEWCWKIINIHIGIRKATDSSKLQTPVATGWQGEESSTTMPGPSLSGGGSSQDNLHADRRHVKMGWIIFKLRPVASVPRSVCRSVGLSVCRSVGLSSKKKMEERERKWNN